MKKQVLFLIVAAFFAGTMAFGQVCSVPGSLTRGVNCITDALHPMAGTAYNYQARGVPGGGDFLFWATKDPDFITTNLGVTTNNILTKLNSPTTTPVGTDLTATSANYAVPGVRDSVSITWSDAILSTTDTTTSPTFVAVYYTAPAAGCADNFNAWRIEPKNAFIVDIKNIHDGDNVIQPYDTPVDECVDVVRGAVYSGGQILYDFGSDTLYYEVVAANFTVSWTPTLTVDSLHAAQTSVIEWTCDAPASWAGTTWRPSNTTVGTNETNTSKGVSIYVRVIVSHHVFECLAPRRIFLAVDGVNSVNQWDIENNNLGSVGPLCNDGALNDKMDIALQTLKPRPTLTPVTPIPFLPGNKQN